MEGRSGGMSNENDQDGNKKPLSLQARGKLELRKPIEATQVRQSFSHGRSKTVTVEVKKSRHPVPGQREDIKPPPGPAPGSPGEGKQLPPPVNLPPRKPNILRELTADERAARERVLREQAIRAAEEKRLAEEEAKRRAIEEAQRKLEEEARLKAEEEARLKAEAEAKAKAEAEAAAAAAAAAERVARGEPAELPPEPPAKKVLYGPAAAPVERAQPVAKIAIAHPVVPVKARAAEEDEEDSSRGGAVKRPGGGPAKAPLKRPGGNDAKKPSPGGAADKNRRQGGKVNVTSALSDEEGARQRSLASVRRARERERLRYEQRPAEKVIRDVIIPDLITVQELAARMAERAADVIKMLMRMGVMATITQSIDADTAELIVTEFGHTPKRQSESDVEIGLGGGNDTDETLIPRPPVVTVMGHVDHGKTSLLDALRKTDVVSREAGGITQHIGAYQVNLPSGQRITFIDTPGHEAFTSMRARGANVTDIVVLVVAADDGIMPQTVEAINHAKAAGVPMVVAVNKIDKPAANPERVRQELLQHGLVVEELGGELLAIDVSAKSGIGLDKLEEAILLQAEILDLKANPNRVAEATVVESQLDRGRGSVATVLVRRGTLRVGDAFVVGSEWGRVRALVDDHGRQIPEAGPACPVEVLGLQGTPSAGDELIVVETEARAREISDFRSRKKRELELASVGRGTVEQMLSKIAAGDAKELPIIVKTDVQGSLEAIVASIQKIGTEEVSARVLSSGVGAISESDVTLARASSALIIAFNVRANAPARELAKRDGVDIRYYSIIYNVIDDVKAALSGLLTPVSREEFLGYAEIRQIFDIPKVGKVAGCMVTEGMVKRGSKVRLLRDNVVIHEGTLKTLRRFKDEVKEVKNGFECGMAFENYSDIRESDVIECFEIVEETRSL